MLRASRRTTRATKDAEDESVVAVCRYGEPTTEVASLNFFAKRAAGWTVERTVALLNFPFPPF